MGITAQNMPYALTNSLLSPTKPMVASNSLLSPLNQWLLGATNGNQGQIVMKL